MLNLMKKMIRRAVVTSGLIKDSESDLRVQQVKYLGKSADIEIIFPYGMSANVSNDSIGTMWSIQCNAEYRVALFDDPVSRPRDLEQNEVVYYHPKTGSKIHFKNNGDIDITATGSSINIEGDIVVNGNYTQTGNMGITGDITLEGNMGIIGDITQTGSIGVTGSITASVTVQGANVIGTVDVVGGGISLKGHVHGGVTTGTSSTFVPT